MTHLAQALQGGMDLGAGTDVQALLHRFLPAQAAPGGRDPFALVDAVLTRVTRNRGNISLIAVPTFLWFSTRLFASVRTALNEIYDVGVRPAPSRNFLVAYLLGKARDVVMVLVTLVLFLSNAVLTAGLAVLQARGVAVVVPELQFFVTTLGRFLGEAVAFAFQLVLFYAVYRYASLRRLPRITALLSAAFAAVGFEIAKRLFALYLANFTSLEGVSGDANIGAIVLFVLWVYYTALVFLLGGVVGEIWQLRRMQREQRAILE